MNLNLFDEFSYHERENNFMQNENYGEISRFPDKTPLNDPFRPIPYPGLSCHSAWFTVLLGLFPSAAACISSQIYA